MSTKVSPDYARLNELLQRILAFNHARNWSQFHNPKDLAISLSLEASEVLEHFQWKSPEEIKRHLAENGDKVADELADVLYWTLLMSNYFEIDLPAALDRKMGENEAKYPVEKAKNSHAKYNELT
jgi:NTP pyrophosphatase (non-canonical NTP hydrolase)